MNNSQSKTKYCHKHKTGDVKAKIPKKELHYVHELVAKAFVPNPDNLPYVEHIDGNRSNNNADNLRWTSIRPDGYPETNSKNN